MFIRMGKSVTNLNVFVLTVVLLVTQFGVVDRNEKNKKGLSQPLNPFLQLVIHYSLTLSTPPRGTQEHSAATNRPAGSHRGIRAG
jgi:hypothetical protein